MTSFYKEYTDVEIRETYQRAVVAILLCRFSQQKLGWIYPTCRVFSDCRFVSTNCSCSTCANVIFFSIHSIFYLLTTSGLDNSLEGQIFRIFYSFCIGMIHIFVFYMYKSKRGVGGDFAQKLRF